jgi:diacylglycerol kinase family enzyme
LVGAATAQPDKQFLPPARVDKPGLLHDMSAMSTTRGTAIIVNRQSGTVRGMGADAARALIEGAFGSGADILLVSGAEVEPTVKRILDGGGHDRIIVGGGDGTVTSIAGQLAGTGVSMGILPFGTMNLMAKSIGMSGDLAEALEQLQHAQPQKMDAARASGRLFLHHVSFGLQPRIVRIREKLGYNSRLTKILAGMRALIGVLLKPQSQRLSLEVDGRRSDIKAPVLIVSNNIYEDSAWLRQAKLDEGLLGVYALKPMSRLALIGVALDLLRGRWRENLNISEEHARRVQVAFSRRRRFGRRKRSIWASIDGELSLLDLPLDITTEPGVLSLLVPLPGTLPGTSPPEARLAPVQANPARLETAMADNIENQYQQRNVRSRSSATGWILGVIIALAVIGILWFYGTRDTVNVTNTTTNAPVTTTEPPAATAPVGEAPATQPPAATAPATEPPAATETAPATGNEPLPAPSPVDPAPAPENP